MITTNPHISESPTSTTVSIETSIFVRTQFEGTHFYAEAPEEVAFLRNPHRHIFHVECELQVFHDDRELEFILVKRALNLFLAELSLKHMSCEMIAEDIISWANAKYGFRKVAVCVSEDGENGARVIQKPISF